MQFDEMNVIHSKALVKTYFYSWGIRNVLERIHHSFLLRKKVCIETFFQFLEVNRKSNFKSFFSIYSILSKYQMWVFRLGNNCK